MKSLRYLPREELDNLCQAVREEIIRRDKIALADYPIPQDILVMYHQGGNKVQALRAFRDSLPTPKPSLSALKATLDTRRPS